MNLSGNVVVKDLGKNIDALAVKIGEGARRGLIMAGEHALGVSNQIVPLEEGDLARSGSVTQDDASVKTAVSYDTDYAVKQHEDESLHHDAGRQAKFLETAMTSQRETMLAIVQQAVKGAMGT
jgi:hypothetical protein